MLAALLISSLSAGGHGAAAAHARSSPSTGASGRTTASSPSASPWPPPPSFYSQPGDGLHRCGGCSGGLAAWSPMASGEHQKVVFPSMAPGEQQNIGFRPRLIWWMLIEEDLDVFAQIDGVHVRCEEEFHPRV